RTASRCGVQSSVEGFPLADCLANDPGSRRRRGTAVRIVAGLPRREKRDRNVQCAEHPRANVPRQQMERRRPDGGRELPLGGIGTRESRGCLSTRPGFVSKWQARLQLRMAHCLGRLPRSSTRCGRPPDQFSGEESHFFERRRRSLLVGAERGTCGKYPACPQLLEQSGRAFPRNLFRHRCCRSSCQTWSWRRKSCRISRKNSTCAHPSSI